MTCCFFRVVVPMTVGKISCPSLKLPGPGSIAGWGVVPGPQGGQRRGANRRRGARFRLDQCSDVSGPHAADELGRALHVQRSMLPITQAKRVIGSERVRRRTNHAIDEHAIEHELGKVELAGNRSGPRTSRRRSDPRQHPPYDRRVPRIKGGNVVRIRWCCRRQSQQGAGYAVPNHVARQPIVDMTRVAKEAHRATPGERFGGERPKELHIGIGDQHRVVLRSRDHCQLDHLLLNPTTHRWERPAQVDLDVNERYGHERAWQKVGLAPDMRSWTGEPTEQLEVRTRHDDVMLNRVRRIVEHRPVQVHAHLEVRCVAYRGNSKARHGPHPNDFQLRSLPKAYLGLNYFLGSFGITACALVGGASEPESVSQRYSISPRSQGGLIRAIDLWLALGISPHSVRAICYPRRTHGGHQHDGWPPFRRR